MVKRIIYLICLGTLINSCQKESLEIIQPPKQTKSYFDTSYNLSKSNIWIDYYSMLEENNINFGTIAYGCPEVIADFDGDGFEDLLAAPTLYENAGGYGDLPLEFFKNQGDNKTFTLTPFTILGEVGTFNARKGLLGDYNNDGKPDVAYPEQGVDMWPTEGSTPTLLISSETGYKLVNLSETKYYLHTGASGDIDNDGDLDIIMSSQHVILTFLNNGDGTFTETDLIVIPPDSKQQGFVTMELFDINKDGYLDLIAGGDENNLQTRVYFGNGIDFSYLRSQIIPFSSPWEGVIDFDFADINQDGFIDIITGRFKNVYEGYYIEVISTKDYQIIDNIVDNSLANDIRWPIWIRVQDIDDDGELDIISNDKGNLGYGSPHWEWNGSKFNMK
ncbi:MAG: VCBS repeat-containing protein [Polaribacter sp.]|nr:VCBS repeat-containing protein [Polaribacter sp.]MDG1810924.1 VCBS repeat-containing protein [Polaribacter sp.]MDG1994035.1 VCBS repeat-containing protein [Polaribacter sp.]